jgi:hypothetical protein
MARRIIAAVLVILAALLAPFSVGALWVQRTVMEPGLFVETLSPLADDPVVQQAVAEEASSALIEAVDAEARVSEALSRFNGPLAGLIGTDSIAASIASGINGAIESGVQSYTQSDRFGDAWLALAGVLQQQLVRLIERDTTDAAVSLQDGKIVLDTKVAVDKIGAELAQRGVPFADQLSVPGREVVLADSPNLQLAADALHVFVPVASWMWVGVVAMFIIGILLWRPRSRGLLWTGIGLMLGGIATYIALDLGEAALVSTAPDGYAGVLDAVSSVLLRFLVNALLVMICLGFVLALAGWLAGGTRSGRRVRVMIADAAHRWGGPLADTPLGRFTSEHPMFVPTLRAVVLLVALGYLVAVDRLSPATVLWTTVVAGLALLAVEVVEGSGLSREQARHGALVAEAIDPSSDQPAAQP